jgi:hypothetical protein
MSPTAPSASRDDLIAVALAALWFFGVRAALGLSWGFDAIPTSSGELEVGIGYNAGDTWSYLSWVRQYQNGTALASLLYTAEPHAALLWIFPLWSVGQIAALTGLPTIGVFNAAGFVGALGVVWGFRRAATTVGLGRSACNWATVALLLGSGASWTTHIAQKLGWGTSTTSPELFFSDLLPSTALLVSPYHALGLALVATLWWRALRLETALLERRPAVASALVVAVIAALLGFSRPYEPLAFLGAWTLKTAWHGLHRQTAPEAWGAALQVNFAALACVPGIAWSVWVSTRPVWSTFASESLSLGTAFTRPSWALALAGWVVLACLATYVSRRSPLRNLTLPVAATLLFFIVLVGIGSGRTKLASGLFFGPALLAGLAAEHLVRALPRLSTPVRVPLAAVLLFLLFGLPSLQLGLLMVKLNPSGTLAPALPALATHLPLSPSQPPLVLASPASGAALPGLVGARVWAGHFSLTHRFWEKRSRLRAAGLDPGTPPTDPVQALAALNEILVEAPFDFALLEPTSAAARVHLLSLGWTIVATSGGWMLLSAPPRSAS